MDVGHIILFLGALAVIGGGIGYAIDVRDRRAER